MKNAANAAPSATVRSPRLKYASKTATTNPPAAERGEPVLENTAGKVIAAKTVYGT